MQAVTFCEGGKVILAEVRVTGWDTQWRCKEAIRSPGTSRTSQEIHESVRGEAVRTGVACGEGYVSSLDNDGSWHPLRAYPEPGTV